MAPDCDGAERHDVAVLFDEGNRSAGLVFCGLVRWRAAGGASDAHYHPLDAITTASQGRTRHGAMRYARKVAQVIVRRFKAGTSMATLRRQFGRHQVNAALREAL